MGFRTGRVMARTRITRDMIIDCMDEEVCTKSNVFILAMMNKLVWRRLRNYCHLA